MKATCGENWGSFLLFSLSLSPHRIKCDIHFRSVPEHRCEGPVVMGNHVIHKSGKGFLVERSQGGLSFLYLDAGNLESGLLSLDLGDVVMKLSGILAETLDLYLLAT
jgi:hypothetical protein